MLYPKVLKLSKENVNQVSLELLVEPELDYFPGHFPDQPILPGVVQIDWVMHFASQHFTLQTGFTSLEQVKFQALMLPNAAITLQLTWHALKNKIEFSYISTDRQYSSGRIVLGRIT